MRRGFKMKVLAKQVLGSYTWVFTMLIKRLPMSLIQNTVAQEVLIDSKVNNALLQNAVYANVI